MYSCALIVGLLLVANLYTVGQVLKAVIFSHRRHLQRTISKLYAVKAEGFLNALKAEVNLMTDMVRICSFNILRGISCISLHRSIVWTRFKQGMQKTLMTPSTIKVY